MKSNLEQRLEKLFSSGRYEDLVYGVRCGLALGISPEEICRIAHAQRYSGRGPWPLILIDGWQIGATLNRWIYKPYQEGRMIYQYTDGYLFDFTTKKEET